MDGCVKRWCSGVLLLLFVLHVVGELLELLLHSLHLLEPHDVVLPEAIFDLRHVLLDLPFASWGVGLDAFQVAPESLVHCNQLRSTQLEANCGLVL